MPIDFDATALKAGMDTFAIAVTITPMVSQPSGVAYSARGVWIVEDYTLVAEGEMPIVTQNYKLGLRLDEIAVPPTQGDNVTIQGKTYWFDSPNYDGQGGVQWILKAWDPMQQTLYAQ